MNIGELAVQSGIAAKTIRHYESIGLVPPAQRAGNGYRVYTDADIGILRFIYRARDLGFSLKEIGELLDLWMDKRRNSASVKALAMRHIADIDRKIVEMQSFRLTLDNLVRRCRGDGRPDCPILEDLAQTKEAPAPPVNAADAAASRRRAGRINSRKAVAQW